MNKVFLIIVFIFTPLAFLRAQYSKIPEGVTADTVIQNYISAIGGKENILKVKDRTTFMNASVQERKLTLTIYQKEPNKLLQVINSGGMEIKIIFNGEKGFQVTAAGKHEISGAALEDMKIESNLNAVVDYARYGIKATLVGVEKLNDKNVFKLEMELPGGKKYYEFYDPESALKIKQIKTLASQNGSVEQVSDFSDYQLVDGVKYPFKIIQTMGSQKIEATVTSIKVNQNLDDKLFEVEK
ncbi:MAG: hypothetical protein NTX22_16725 [Ignavibacteriales bacterium]|nr:hypothetical protein [Ignavibacteriales bacterium]